MIGHTLDTAAPHFTRSFMHATAVGPAVGGGPALAELHAAMVLLAETLKAQHEQQRVSLEAAAARHEEQQRSLSAAQAAQHQQVLAALQALESRPAHSEAAASIGRASVARAVARAHVRAAAVVGGRAGARGSREKMGWRQATARAHLRSTQCLQQLTWPRALRTSSARPRGTLSWSSAAASGEPLVAAVTLPEEGLRRRAALRAELPDLQRGSRRSKSASEL